MEINTISYTSKVFYSLVSNEIFSNAIGEITLNIYQLLFKLVEKADTKLDIILEDLDIRSQIICIESVLKTIPKETTENAITLSLESLHEMIFRIKQDLELLNKKINQYNQSFMNYFTKINIQTELDNLIRHKKILDYRLDLFINILKIQKLK